MAQQNRPRELLRDIPFLTGAYLLFISLLIIANQVIVKFENVAEPDDFITISIDMMSYISGLASLIVMLLIVGIPRKYLAVILIPLTCFIVDTYFLLGPSYQVSSEMLWRFDFWNFLTLATLCIFAFLRRDLSKSDYLALVGWSLYIFGNVLLKAIGYESDALPGYVPFLPLVAALAFWIPSLWTGNRQSSSL